jgi:hypothetical protein
MTPTTSRFGTTWLVIGCADYFQTLWLTSRPDPRRIRRGHRELISRGHAARDHRMSLDPHNKIIRRRTDLTANKSRALSVY